MRDFMARADRRRAEQQMARDRRHIDRAIANGQMAPPPHWGPRPAPADETMEGGASLTVDMATPAVTEDQKRAQRQAAEYVEKTRRLIESIPEHLRDTPEANLMVARVQASWGVPFPPKVAERFMREWHEFLMSQPENVAQRVPLWLPRP